MMINEFSQQSQLEPVWVNYRKIRKGLIGGSRLEEKLKEDLKDLFNVFKRGTFSEIELLFTKQSLEAVCEVFKETLVALEEFISFVEDKGSLDNTEKVVRFINENVKDAETRQRIINRLLLNGGVRNYLGIIQTYLDVKSNAYDHLLEKLRNGGTSVFPELVSEITINLDTLTEEELKEYWKKKLEEEAKKYKGQLYNSSVAWELCQKYPKIALELGVMCPTDLFISGAIIMCAIIVLLAIAWSCEG